MNFFGYSMLFLIVLILADIASELTKIRKAMEGKRPESGPVTHQEMAEMERQFREELDGRKR